MTTRQLQVGVAVAAALAVVGVFFIYGNPLDTTSTMTDSMGDTNIPQAQGDLVTQDTVVGTGAEAAAGDTITVNYTGKFQNGTVFDTSVGKQPFTFTLGAGQVIRGWDMGVAGMKVGGKRVLVVSPALGYGPNDYGPIPGNSTLVFEVELLKVQKAQ